MTEWINNIVSILVVMLLPVVFLGWTSYTFLFSRPRVLPTKVNQVSYIDLDEMQIKSTHDSLTNELIDLTQQIAIATNKQQQLQLTIDTLEAKIRLVTN